MVVQFENNIYAQIGLVMLIGLAAKNAILIVEFAKMGWKREGRSSEAALEGAKLRLRPILIPSLLLSSVACRWRNQAAPVHCKAGHVNRRHRRHAGREFHSNFPYSGNFLPGRQIHEASGRARGSRNKEGQGNGP